RQAPRGDRDDPEAVRSRGIRTPEVRPGGPVGALRHGPEVGHDTPRLLRAPDRPPSRHARLERQVVPDPVVLEDAQRRVVQPVLAEPECGTVPPERAPEGGQALADAAGEPFRVAVIHDPPERGAPAERMEVEPDLVPVREG